MSIYIKEISEKLDILMLRSIELMEEKMKLTIEMENQLKDGYLELALTRYIRGKESIGMYQIPQGTPISTLFNLEMTLDVNEFQTGTIPHYDITLKNSQDIDTEKQNPIRWFGVLVPQNLKLAQKRFQECTYLATRIANINAELETISCQVQREKRMKNQLKHVPEE